MSEHTLVAFQHCLTVAHKVEEQTVAEIAALPHSVDQSLIVGVHRHKVLALD